jgi:uncharacterized protein (DUF1330 family)
MPVYFVAEIQEIKDQASYLEYIESVEMIIQRYGGKYLVRGGNSVTVSGGWKPIKLIVIRFDSIEKLQECFNSADYREIAPLREKATVGRAIAVEGIDT